MAFELTGKKIWVAGETGLVGAATLRRLAREDCTILHGPRAVLDLTRQADTEEWLAAHKPDAVILAAARVGGIGANNASPADFIQDNLSIAQNVIHGAYKAGVAKLLFLGSSCIYPKHAAQPIVEEALLTGPLEPTNEWYAVAKIAGLKLCQAYRRQHGCAFISVMPTNLYGPGDRFDAHNSHVLPALMLKMQAAKERGEGQVHLWGTGSPLREFLHVDDLADALVHLMGCYSGDVPLNIGSGQEFSIAELAEKMKQATGYTGDIVFDPGHPDGTPRKRLDCARLDAFGWRASIPFDEGLRQTYQWFMENVAPSQARAA